MAEHELPERLRIELEGWGFGDTFSGPSGEHLLVSDGAHLVWRDEYDEDYVLASSTYHGEDVTPARPFLATVLEVLRWATTDHTDGSES